MDDEQEHHTPRLIVGAVAAGVAPLPFLAIYALLFLIHGSVHPVSPPDITDSTRGEFIAGLIAFALLVLGAAAVYRLLTGRGRILFLLCQLATLGTAIYFLVDRSTGPIGVPVLLAITSAIAVGSVIADALPRTSTAAT